MAGWYLCLLLVVVVMAGGAHGSDTTNSTCAPAAFSKVLFNQTESLQFVEYDVEMPDLESFTLHYWIHLLQPSTFVCPFTYYNEADETYIQVLIVRNDMSWSWVMQVNGVVVSVVKSPSSLVGKWHHVLHSWHSDTGTWSFYLDEQLVATATDEKTKGMVVSGGGRAYSGHRRSVLSGSVPCDRCGEGLHGWLTLLSLDTRGIQRADFWMTRLMVSVVAGKCTPEMGEDLLTWDHTPRRSYGGVLGARANTTCGHF